MDIIRAIEQQQIKPDVAEFNVGDNVKFTIASRKAIVSVFRSSRVTLSVVMVLQTVKLLPFVRSAFLLE